MRTYHFDAAPPAPSVQPPIISTPTNPPAVMDDSDVIAYLRLDRKPGDPMERLRNLIRRQGLPVKPRGQTRFYRLEEIDAWIDGGRSAVNSLRAARKTQHPARLPANYKASQ